MKSFSGFSEVGKHKQSLLVHVAFETLFAIKAKTNPDKIIAKIIIAIVLFFIKVSRLKRIRIFCFLQLSLNKNIFIHQFLRIKMDFDAVVRRRRSVRKFKKKKVDFRFLMEAVDSANQGPFPDNHNHLKFLIVEDKEIIKKISECCEQDWVDSAPALIVVCSDDTHLENLYGMRGRVYSRQTAGAAVYALMLKFADYGIGSCWVGAYSDSEMRKILEIPKDIQIEAVVPIGFPDEKIKRKDKKKLDKVLYWEKWGASRRPSWFEEREKDLN